VPIVLTSEASPTEFFSSDGTDKIQSLGYFHFCKDILVLLPVRSESQSMMTEEKEDREDPLQNMCFLSCPFQCWCFPRFFFFLEAPDGAVNNGIIILVQQFPQAEV